ncbi:terminase small subunit [Xanthomonas phage NED111]|uniref:Terminase small subunit n=3 Tax=Pradovirus TaxID=1985733 RepID=A0A249XLG0_9CAUD|nr:terminase small subunit [Xanthomonas phage phi Xc10]ASZ72043.1 terminase small subunit [Xanthomonas phage phi Xc10]UUR56230.1 terminase small subunit [Xanthomonas phage pXoo2106]UZV39780.1 terminase small subunit [Xanthomonas phage NED111]
MSNPASEGALGALHELVATVLKERLANGELCTAADINAAIKFLKDNNITATREANKALGELEDELGKHSLPQADDTELQAALDNIVNFPGSVANHA